MKTAIELITEERNEQLSRHGYDAKNDATQDRAQIALAATGYAQAAIMQQIYERASFASICDSIESLHWPATWTPPNISKDPVRNLVKAGALIAAEIDRLLARNPTPASNAEGDTEKAVQG